MSRIEENGNIEKDPFKDREAIFARLERIASMDNLTAEQRAQYEESWKNYNDYYNTLDFAMQKGIEKGRKEGMEKGRKEGLCQIAINMKKEGIQAAIIAKCTGLSQEEIEALS